MYNMKIKIVKMSDIIKNKGILSAEFYIDNDIGEDL